MFGYVTPNLSALSKPSRREYKAYYCGLCNALRDRYGATARFILNYDTTFLYLFSDALTKQEKHTSRICPYHFCKKCESTTGALAEYSADVTVLLTYLNFEDDIKDDKSVKARILKRIYRKAFEKAKAAQPELCNKIWGYLEKLHECEKENETNADIPSGIFGNLLGDVFSVCDNAYEFGYYLGKFIYLSDAACDFKKDIKRGSYNPLIHYRIKDFKSILSSVMGDCIKAYNALDIKMNGDIITNVLYDGIWMKYHLKYKFKGEQN